MSRVFDFSETCDLFAEFTASVAHAATNLDNPVQNRSFCFPRKKLTENGDKLES